MKFVGKSMFTLLALILFVPSAFAEKVSRDDLRRGLAVLRERAYLHTKPEDDSPLVREELEVNKSYYLLGLSLDGQWARILTPHRQRGWIRIGKIERLPDPDASLTGDFVKIERRESWRTNKFLLSGGVMTTQDLTGELGFVLMPNGVNGLRGETLELVAGITMVKATPVLASHVAVRGLLQWPFRALLRGGNLSIGPRIGYERRHRYDSTAIVSTQTGHNIVLGLIFRFMPNPYFGFILSPEFLIQPTATNVNSYGQAMAGFTLLL